MAQIIRVTLSMTIYSQICQNVLHFNDTSGAYSPTGIAAEIVSKWINEVKGFQNPGLHYYNVAVKNLDDAGGITTDVPVDVFGGGFFGSQTWPTTAVLVQIKTPFGGRTGRGRIFIAGLHTGAFENGLFNASTVTSLNAFMTNLKNHFLAAGDSFLKIGVRGRGPAAAWKAADNLVVGNRPGIQRRRNIGVGV